MKENAVTLRKITENDIPLILRWRNSKSVRDNFVVREPFTEESQKKWINDVINKGKAVQYIISNGERPIGSVYIRDIDYTHKNGEFGIYIGEAGCAGNGFGLLAAKEILKIAFDEIGLRRVYLRVFTDNVSAIKTYEKAGFKTEGILKDTVFVDGEFKDMLLMAIINN